MPLKRDRSKTAVRDHWIKVRVTKEEQEKINLLAKKSGMAVGNLIRERLLGTPEEKQEEVEKQE